MLVIVISVFLKWGLNTSSTGGTNCWGTGDIYIIISVFPPPLPRSAIPEYTLSCILMLIRSYNLRWNSSPNAPCPNSKTTGASCKNKYRYILKSSIERKMMMSTGPVRKCIFYSIIALTKQEMLEVD